MEEEWRAVVGFEGYEVSNLGRLRSFLPPNGRGPFVVIPKLLKPGLSCKKGSSNFRVTLRKGKKKYYPSVHSMVLEAFVGPRPDGMEGCHFPDPDVSNNKVTNLMWGTSKQNQEHRRVHGSLPEGESHVSSKLNKEKVLNIRIHLFAGMSSVRLAREHGVTKSTILALKWNKTWKDVWPDERRFT